MTGATHASSLLFCLFSFLFGIGMAGVHALLYGVLAALRLLPPVSKRMTDAEPSSHAGIDAPPSAGKGKARRFVLGYLILDITAFLLFAVFYLLFLFLLHGGVFRIYSLLLAASGMLLTYRCARPLIARPVAFLLSLPLHILQWLFFSVFRPIFSACRRKKPKQLDETDKMV